MLISVDLPAPFGPMTEVIMPGRNVRLSASTRARAEPLGHGFEA